MLMPMYCRAPKARRAVVLAALPFVLLAGCGGSKSGGGGATTPTTGTGTSSQQPSAAATAPADPSAAMAQITTAWETFFSSSTGVATATGLLEDGSQLGPALQKAQQEDKATGGHRSAKVKKITFTDATHANVEYKLHVGATVLNSSGVAVFQDGAWKVSKITFCTLVELGNNEKPVKSC